MQPINRGFLNGPDRYIKRTPGKAFNVTFGGLKSRMDSITFQVLESALSAPLSHHLIRTVCTRESKIKYPIQ